MTNLERERERRGVCVCVCERERKMSKSMILSLTNKLNQYIRAWFKLNTLLYNVPNT